MSKKKTYEELEEYIRERNKRAMNPVNISHDCFVSFLEMKCRKILLLKNL